MSAEEMLIKHMVLMSRQMEFMAKQIALLRQRNLADPNRESDNRSEINCVSNDNGNNAIEIAPVQESKPNNKWSLWRARKRAQKNLAQNNNVNNGNISSVPENTRRIEWQERKRAQNNNVYNDKYVSSDSENYKRSPRKKFLRNKYKYVRSEVRRYR
ncbi:hypothetical protein ACFFRR_003688 [Megaselia abdita]